MEKQWLCTMKNCRNMTQYSRNIYENLMKTPPFPKSSKLFQYIQNHLEKNEEVYNNVSKKKKKKSIFNIRIIYSRKTPNVFPDDDWWLLSNIMHKMN